MRPSTIIILAVCLFSVAFANNNGPEPANNLGPSNSQIGAGDESKRKRISLSLEPATAEGDQPKDPNEPKDPKKPKKPRRKHRLPRLPIFPKPWRPKKPKVPEVPKEPKAPKDVWG